MQTKLTISNVISKAAQTKLKLNAAMDFAAAMLDVGSGFVLNTQIKVCGEEKKAVESPLFTMQNMFAIIVSLDPGGVKRFRSVL